MGSIREAMGKDTFILILSKIRGKMTILKWGRCVSFTVYGAGVFLVVFLWVDHYFVNKCYQVTERFVLKRNFLVLRLIWKLVPFLAIRAKISMLNCFLIKSMHFKTGHPIYATINMYTDIFQKYIV